MIRFLPESAGEENATNHIYDVFISYSSVDQPWVRDVLIKVLEENGLKVCVDYRDFVPGAAIMENITRAITESKVTILVLTPNYVESKWCHYETRYAIGMSLSSCEGECGRGTNLLSWLVCVVLCLFTCISQLVFAYACFGVCVFPCVCVILCLWLCSWLWLCVYLFLCVLSNICVSVCVCVCVSLLECVCLWYLPIYVFFYFCVYFCVCVFISVFVYFCVSVSVYFCIYRCLCLSLCLCFIA